MRTTAIQFKLSNSLGNTANSALTIIDEGKRPKARYINILVGGIISSNSVLLEGISIMVFQNVKIASWCLVALELQSSGIFTKMCNNG